MDTEHGAVYKRITGARVSHEQREQMLEFMESHRGFASNRLHSNNSASHKQELWARLADMLNACPTGAMRTPAKWAKTWQDWRLDIKQKAARLRKHAKGTGRSPHLKATPLTKLEERALSLLEEAAVDGQEEVPDPLTLHKNIGNAPQKTLILPLSIPLSSSPISFTSHEFPASNSHDTSAALPFVQNPDLSLPSPPSIAPTTSSSTSLDNGGCSSRREVGITRKRKRVPDAELQQLGTGTPTSADEHDEESSAGNSNFQSISQLPISRVVDEMEERLEQPVYHMVDEVILEFRRKEARLAVAVKEKELAIKEQELAGTKALEDLKLRQLLLEGDLKRRILQADLKMKEAKLRHLLSELPP